MVKMMPQVIIQPASITSRRVTSIMPSHGDLYLQKGMLGEAISTLKRLIGFDPVNASAHASLGYAYISKGLLDEAIGEYKRVIELKPDSSYAHYLLGTAYIKKGMLEQAVSELKESSLLIQVTQRRIIILEVST